MKTVQEFKKNKVYHIHTKGFSRVMACILKDKHWVALVPFKHRRGTDNGFILKRDEARIFFPEFNIKDASLIGWIDQDADVFVKYDTI
jgi:hypothetical protein